MIKSHYFPSRTFTSKEELFKALKDSEMDIIEFKTANVYKGCDKSTTIGKSHNTKEATKGIGFATKENYIYPIISTTRYMDSHDDVHFDGCFTKTVKEQQGKVYYCADHNLSLSGIIASKKNVEMMVEPVDWSIVGKKYQGQTEALVFAIDKAKITNQLALDMIESDPELENSIRMQYVKVQMGIDSMDKMYAENKRYYDSRIGEIANADVVKEQGYFFGVEELKIHKEGSMVIAGGSNDATRIYTEPTKVTQTIIEPTTVTQTERNKDYSKIKFI